MVFKKYQSAKNERNTKKLVEQNIEQLRQKCKLFKPKAAISEVVEHPNLDHIVARVKHPGCPAKAHFLHIKLPA